MKTSKAVHPTHPITLAVLTALYGTAAWSADALNDATNAASATASASETDTLQEVTVTATRREASAQDLPMSITAVTGDQLEAQGIEDLSALSHTMAGVNYTDKGPFSAVNGSSLIIRGLNSEATAGQLALATSIVPPVAGALIWVWMASVSSLDTAAISCWVTVSAVIGSSGRGD